MHMTREGTSAPAGGGRPGGRNSAVELCRFLFCLEIMLWHGRKLAPKGTELILCGKHGYIGVEFFFFVTGWLIAARASRDEWNKMKAEGGSLFSDTKRFFLGKIRAIFPVALFAYIGSYVCLTVLGGLSAKALIVKMLKSLWEMCFLYISGVVMQSSVVGGSWYVSAMLLAGTVVYVLRRRLGPAWFSCFIAPLAYILISGWLFRNYSNLNVIITEYAIVAPGLIRAFGEISLGCFLYEISIRLRRMDLTLLGRACVTLATVAGLLFVFYSTTIGFDGIKRIEYIMAPVLAATVLLLFSEQGLFFLHRSQALDRVLLFLGKLSLPIYLNHLWIRSIFRTLDWPYWKCLAAFVACTFVVSIVCLWTVSLWEYFWKTCGASVKRCFIKEKAE